MTRRTQGIWPCGAKGGLSRAFLGAAAVLLAAGLAVPCRAATPGEVEHTLSIPAGERRDVYVHLGIDDRPDLVFGVRLERDGAWPEEDGLQIGIVDPATDKLKRRAEIRHTPAGRTLRLVALAPRDAEPGVYPAAVLISSTEEPADGGVTRREKVRLRFIVEPGAGLAAGTVARWLLAAALAPVFFFAWSSCSHSRLLCPARLAECLQPLEWDKDRRARPYANADGRTDSILLSHVASRFEWLERVREWLKANPLVFGLPGRRYEETVRLTPGIKLEQLNVEVVSPRRPPRRGEEPRDLRPGDLYARALAGDRVEIFGRPDERGRLAGLVPEGEVPRDFVWRELTLLTSEREPHRSAGWKISTSRLGASQRVWSRLYVEAGQ